MKNKTNVIAAFITVQIMMRTTITKVERHLSLEEIKIHAFHAFMIPQYASKRLCNWLIREGVIALMMIIHPMRPWLRGTIYYTSISITVIMLILVEVIKHLVNYAANRDHLATKTKSICALYHLLLITRQ